MNAMEWIPYVTLALNFLLLPLLAVLWKMNIAVTKLELQAVFSGSQTAELKEDMKAIRSETTAAALAAANAAANAALAASNAAAAIAEARARREINQK